MKNRIIFTLHIENKKDFKSKQLSRYANGLIHRQEEYAKKCGADYKVFVGDKKYDDFQYVFLNMLEISESDYQDIQHYKHYLMQELSKEYKEVLYLDLDVFINTEENIFEKFDLKNGVGIYGYLDDKPEDQKNLKRGLLSYIPRETSVSVKTAAMISLCSNAKCTFPNYVFNTAIILTNNDICNQINYFSEMEEVRDNIAYLQEFDDWWADYIRNYFSINNETVYSYLIHKNKVKWQSIGPEWHYPYNARSRNDEIPEDSKFIHVINKDFVKIFAKYQYWEWCYL